MSLFNPDAKQDLRTGQRVVWFGDRGQVLGRGVVLDLVGDLYTVQLDDVDDDPSEIHRLRVVREEGYAAWLASLSN